MLGTYSCFADRPMTPFQGWTIAVQETSIKSSMIAGNSVRSILVPMRCAQARSQAVVEGTHTCYLVCASCNLCDLRDMSVQSEVIEHCNLRVKA